jgi:hypothetical protein
MIGCYIGRGSLLVSRLDTGGGFFTLSGESEVTVVFDEDNESVQDARNGAHERVDWYVRNRRARLEAECYRIEPNCLELLLKANYTTQGAGSGDIELPLGVIVGAGYSLIPNITPGSIVVEDAVAATVDPADYEVSAKYGLITFLDLTGYTQPFTVSASWASHQAFSLHHETQVFVKARFQGVNKVTGQEVMAEFYRLALDITEELKLVQKGFSPMSVRLQCIPDVSQPLDEALGQYGRIILL